MTQRVCSRWAIVAAHFAMSFFTTGVNCAEDEEAPGGDEDDLKQ
jgi:hypothetical protein